MLLHGLHHGIELDQIDMGHHSDIIQNKGFRSAGKSIPVQNQICPVSEAGKTFFTGIQTLRIPVKFLYLQFVQSTCTVYKLEHALKSGQIYLYDLLVFQIRSHIDTGHKQKGKDAVPWNRYERSNRKHKSQAHENLLPRFSRVILFCHMNSLVNRR